MQNSTISDTILTKTTLTEHIVSFLYAAHNRTYTTSRMRRSVADNGHGYAILPRSVFIALYETIKYYGYHIQYANFYTGYSPSNSESFTVRLADTQLTVAFTAEHFTENIGILDIAYEA